MDWGGTLSCAGSQGNAIIYGKTASDGKPVLHVYDKKGELQHSLVPPGCEHGGGCRYGILEVIISEQPYIAMSCIRCKQISLTRANGIGSESHTITMYSKLHPNNSKRMGIAPGQLCHGPKGKLLVVDMNRGSKSLSILDYSCNVSRHVMLDTDLPLHICYLDFDCHGALVVKTDSELHMVSATSLETSTTIWRVQGEIHGQMCDPNGLCTDGKEKVFIADGCNSRILVLNAEDGSLAKCFNISSLGYIKDVAWCQEESYLLVRHLLNSKWSISHYDIASG